jgi:hypothetical protein
MKAKLMTTAMEAKLQKRLEKLIEQQRRRYCEENSRERRLERRRHYYASRKLREQLEQRQ